MKGRERLGYQVGLIGSIRSSILVRLARRLPSVSPRRVPRLLGIVLGSIASLPLGLWERLRFARVVRGTRVAPDPVFIIGHWRSGTTHLHNLMSLDPSFGAVRMYQTLVPDGSLVTEGWGPRWMQRVMPRKRPMDGMEWPMDAPQEEEIALAKMTPFSWYLSFLFPRQAVESFDRFVLLRGAPERVRREVERTLMRVYRIATRHAGGRRLLLKNPVHTCRIPLLLSLFPNAKFVFIHRSPVDVYESTMNLHRRILELTSLQDVSDDEIDHNVVTLHRRVTEVYLRDRAAIPPGQGVEIAYDELIEKPTHTLAQVYAALGLGDWRAVEPAVAAYLESQASYRKNRFERDPDTRARIEALWAEDFEAWAYPRIADEA